MPVENNKFLSLLGLCQRAGKLVSGELPCEKALKGVKVKLLIISEDASGNTKKKFKNAALLKNVDIICTETKENIGRAIGKDLRSTVAIIDEGFARQLKNLYEKRV